MNVVLCGRCVKSSVVDLEPGREALHPDIDAPLTTRRSLCDVLFVALCQCSHMTDVIIKRPRTQKQKAIRSHFLESGTRSLWRRHPLHPPSTTATVVLHQRCPDFSKGRTEDAKQPSYPTSQHSCQISESHRDQKHNTWFRSVRPDIITAQVCFHKRSKMKYTCNHFIAPATNTKVNTCVSSCF